MSTLPSAPFDTLLAAFVDDAALAPPGSAAVPSALAAHADHRRAAYGPLVGSFLCPASRLAELSAALGPDTSLRLGVVLDTGPGGLSAVCAAVGGDSRLTLAAVEVALPTDGDVAAAAKECAALGKVASYVEVPSGAGRDEALDLLAESDCDAALRIDPGPALPDLAGFVRGCVDRQRAFTCIGGPLRAVRDSGEGVERHGFFNLLAATAAALDGAEADELTELLDSRDPAALLSRLAAVGGPEAEVTRGFFRSFGSRRLEEPVAELRSLGVLT